jgi:FkbM family methyltransferase
MVEMNHCNVYDQLLSLSSFTNLGSVRNLPASKWYHQTAMKREIPFKINKDSDLSQWRADTFWEKEPETILWTESFRALPYEHFDFIDIGANLGIYTLYALSTGIFKRAIAVEPMPLNFEALLQNIILNGFKEDVILYNQPLYSRPIKANFRFEDSRIGASGGQVVEKGVESNLQVSVPVQCLTGDVIIENNLVESCVIKIDVDGLEMKILQGLKKSLSSGIVKGLLVEATTQSYGKISGFLRRFGYSVDTQFDSLENHSTKRRTLSGSAERNLIFSKVLC